MMLYQENELPNDSGRPLSYNTFIDKKKKKMAATMETVLFLYWTELHLPSFKNRGLSNDYKFSISVNRYQL